MLKRRTWLSSLLLLSAPFSFSIVHAATVSEFNFAPASKAMNTFSGQKGYYFQVKRRSADANHTLHLHLQETYRGYPILGGDYNLHFVNQANVNDQQIMQATTKKDVTINGRIYSHLEKDLTAAPETIFTPDQASRVTDATAENYYRTIGSGVDLTQHQAKPIVFVDANNKAHWAYHVSFTASRNAKTGMPAKPNFIVDAETLKIYQQWDNIKTEKSGLDYAGGYGGNTKMGKLVYDGLASHLPKLEVTRNSFTKMCNWENENVEVRSYNSGKIMSFPCVAINHEHGDTYWVGSLDEVNEGFSPSNDALFGGMVIKNLYQEWYKVPVLTDSSGKPMLLSMVVHDPIDNAYWDGQQMTFGDGVSYFYPLTSLGVAAHEISHGFTEQHSDLAYYYQSGGMNEAFSDMAAQAAEYYAYGKNTWQIGPEIFKAEDRALRYMDQPSKDCDSGSEPGDWCSIDTADQYYSGLDVHFSSGVFNRAFYLIATSEGWDTRKAFDAMVKANVDYWTSSSSFSAGACGVIHAAQDLKYNAEDVRAAFEKVGVSTDNCGF